MKEYIGRSVKILNTRKNSDPKVLEIGKITEYGIHDKETYFKVKVIGKKEEWYRKCDLELLKEENKMEIIKFKPTGYEYEMNVHHISFLAENLVFMKEDEDFTWSNRSTIYIQMNNEAEVINLNYSFYFQKVDGTKKMFKLKEVIENSNLVDLLIHYLIECEVDYLLNLKKDYNLDELQEAYSNVVEVIKDEYKITSKVKEHELNELMYEIEVFHMSNAIDKALDEGNEELFYKLTGGKR